MQEEVVSFGENDALNGVLTYPLNINGQKPLVMFLNAGAVHKIGPFRIYVDIARELAKYSFYSLRFDLHGIGDSNIYQGEMELQERIIHSINEAYFLLKDKININKLILIGICSGADAGFQYLLNQKEHFAAGIFVNGYYFNENFNDEIDLKIENNLHQRYYRKKMLKINRWMKFFKGQTNLKNIYRAFKDKSTTIISNKPDFNYSSFTQIDHQANLFFIYSEGSMAFDTYKLIHQEYLNKLTKTNIKVHIVNNVDHTFTPIISREQLVVEIKNWLLTIEF